MPMLSPKPTDITLFAETNFRRQQKRFGIRRADRRYHMYLLGKTGMGKTTLMENLILSDIRSGEGVAVLEPHGDLSGRLLERIPSYRINDVIYIDPADVEFPVGLNMLEEVSPAHRPVLISGVLEVFKMLYQKSWGTKMEHIFRHALLTALEVPKSTLFTVSRLLTDLQFRERIIPRLSDKALQAFWEKEFRNYDKRQRTEAVSPILNKIGQFSADPLIRNIVGQHKSTIRFQEVLDRKRILLANLAKGKIGQDNATLIGALLLTKLQVAALGRANIPEDQRADFYLYVDECQNFLTESLASMMAEMRKYRLNLILANQHLDQLNEFPAIRAAILGNTGTLIAFRTGAPDATVLQEEFFPRVSKQDFVRLPKHQVFLRLMIEGVASEGFSARTLPPQSIVVGNEEKIIRVSRERYGRPLYMASG
ncbi:MAG: TraM recognition domain-containing protein [Calditrichaeota bacterium]|nr:TraM recognition domain-containing protein [Calditrichota bacterium]MCB0294617.1 TraM recognition domain-containing protein [Calditrichota bacterium]MCB0302174.1 TraM recognition domain-containing protein [Calditrichota bacterium]